MAGSVKDRSYLPDDVIQNRFVLDAGFQENRDVCSTACVFHQQGFGVAQRADADGNPMANPKHNGVSALMAQRRKFTHRNRSPGFVLPEATSTNLKYRP